MYKYLILLLLSGCAPYMQATIGHDFGHTKHDIAHIEWGAEHRFSPMWTGHCSWTHVSSPSHGIPFNEREEPYWGEVVGCGLKYGGVR